MEDDFKTKKELWYFIGMIVSIGVVSVLAIWGIITYVLCEDLASRVQLQQETINTYKEEVRLVSLDRERYKMMYEEVYELHVACVENGGECVCQTKNEQP